MSMAHYPCATLPSPLPKGLPGVAQEASAGYAAGAALAAEPNPDVEVELAVDQNEVRILLVEDNWDQAHLLMNYLQKTRHYEVEWAADGSEALYKLAKRKFSLLLLDYCMAGMDGLEVLKRVRARHGNIPIIMTTGMGSESVAAEAFKNGVYDYVVKNGKYFEVLPARIDQALARYQLKRTKEAWDHWILERHRELGALNTISDALGRSIELEEVVRVAVSKTLEVLGADFGQIRFINPPMAGARPAPPPILSPRDLPAESPSGSEEILNPKFLQQVVETGESLVLEDLKSIPSGGEPEAPAGLRSMAYLALKSKGLVRGVLVLGSHKKRHFIKEEVKWLHAIGHQIGAALENALLYKEIRRQREQIAESESKYRTLVEAAGDAVLLIQGNSLFYVNKRACELLKYSTAELYEMSFSDLIAADYKKAVAEYQAAVMSGEEVPPHEIVMVRKDRKEIILNVSGVRADCGGLLLLELIARDVTQQTYIREQLIRTKERSEIGSRALALAHEIKNLLNGIFGDARRLAEPAEFGDRAKPVLEKACGAVRRATELMHHLLSFARQDEFERAPVDVNEILERALARRADSLKLGGIQLTRMLEPDLPWVVADPIPIELAFLNIITNAEQALLQSRRGDRLVVKTSLVQAVADPELDQSGFSGRVESPYIQIEFTDNGPGIDPKDMARLFDPFFTTKGGGTGTGLGLSIARGIIGKHGGEIAAFSDGREGATFLVRLPVPKIDIP